MPGNDDVPENHNHQHQQHQNGGFQRTTAIGGDYDEDMDYVRDLQRPAVIKEDLYEMERRRRVRQVLESKAFRLELEQSMADERRRGGRNSQENLYALERLSKLLTLSPPQQHRNGGGLMAEMMADDGGNYGGGYGNFSAAGSLGRHSYPTATTMSITPPIADLRGTGETSKYSKQERLLRTKLACLFRLLDHFRWSDQRANHATLRLSSDSDELLINPNGVPYRQLTAGWLAKVDLQGNVVDRGSSAEVQVISGFDAHVAIHRARPDLRCLLLLQTPVAVAVSSMECGLLPICQEAMIVGPVSRHDCGGADSSTGLVLEESLDKESMTADLGSNNKVMILRNKGFMVGGQTIEELFHLTYHLVLACETQVRAARAGIDNLCVPSERAQRRAYETAQGGGGGVNKVTPQRGTDPKAGGIKWRVGELEWEAWMRVLDNAGHRTGHIYRQVALLSRAPGAQSDVEVPPAASACGKVDENDSELRGDFHQIQPESRVRWLNSNLYQKVEFQETGTSEPKKLTRWVPDSSSVAPSNPIKISSPHYFTPTAGQNPKEFKDKQKAIKSARRADTINAGPQSKILEGVTWEEAAKMQDAAASGTTEMLVLGAASRGIIDPDYRHNAQMYRQLYQPNPFASITDEEIQGYINHVEGKQQATGGGGGGPGGGGGGMVSRGMSGMSDSSFDEYSLMEGARGRMVAVKEEQESAGSFTSPTNIPQKIQASSAGGWFQRSKSDRYGMSVGRNGKGALTTSPREYPAETSRTTASDEETNQKDGKKSPDTKEKKKRFKPLSFLRSSKKEKESKKKADR